MSFAFLSLTPGSSPLAFRAWFVAVGGCRGCGLSDCSRAIPPRKGCCDRQFDQERGARPSQPPRGSMPSARSSEERKRTMALLSKLWAKWFPAWALRRRPLSGHRLHSGHHARGRNGRWWALRQARAASHAATYDWTLTS
jgi:hypothetical protein